MKPFQPAIPPHVAEVIRSLHPDLAVIRASASGSKCGEPLLRDLDGLLKFRVRRFRIVYAIDRKTRTIRLMAVGHRRHIYEEVAARVQKKS